MAVSISEIVLMIAAMMLINLLIEGKTNWPMALRKQSSNPFDAH